VLVTMWSIRWACSRLGSGSRSITMDHVYESWPYAGAFLVARSICAQVATRLAKREELTVLHSALASSQIARSLATLRS